MRYERGGSPAIVKKVSYALELGTLASWLLRSCLDWAVWVGVQAGGIVLWSWVRHFTLTVPLSTQVYQWVLEDLMLGAALLWSSFPSGGGGVEIFLVTTCYRNRIKLCMMGNLAFMQT